MFDAKQLLEFVAAVVVLVLVPGPNTMIILAQSLGGRRAIGLATVAGIELGTVAHTLAAALGLSVVLATYPLAFNVVKLAGAGYLMVIGIRTMLQPPSEFSDATEISATEAFRRGLVANVLNPKVALFFLAFIPQFIRPERDHLFLQFVQLGLMVSVVGWIFGSALALAASTFAGWLRRHPTFVRWQQRMIGGVFIAIATRVALTG